MPSAAVMDNKLSLTLNADRMTAAASLGQSNVRSSDNVKVSGADKRVEIPVAPELIKLARAVTIVFAVFNIVVFGWSITEEQRLSYTENPGSSSAIPPLPSNAFSLLWSAGCLVVLTVFKQRLHPAFYIALDLVAWVALIVTAPPSISALASGRPKTTCGPYNAEFDCSKDVQRLSALQYTACALSLINAGLHFPIMVWACKKMDHMNMAASRKTFHITVDLDALRRTQEEQDPSPPYENEEDNVKNV